MIDAFERVPRIAAEVPAGGPMASPVVVYHIRQELPPTTKRQIAMMYRELTTMAASATLTVEQRRQAARCCRLAIKAFGERGARHV